MSSQKQPEEHKPEENKPAENNPEEHRLDFFRHDQMAFLVTHGEDAIDAQQGDRLKDDVLEKWGDGIQSLLNQSKWRFEESLPMRSYSFPAVVDDESRVVPDQDREEKFKEAFSIIVFNVKSDDYPTGTNEDRIEAKKGLLDLIESMNERTRTTDFSSAGLTVRGVFPNWIASSGSSNSGGTGGPGGRPSPYNGDPQQIPFYFKGLISTLEGANHSGTNVYGKGKSVDVIILDTAPSADDLVRAYKELWLLPDQQHKHPIIMNLLGPKGRLKLYSATYEEHLRMDNTSLNKHGYKMDDHGLFVAGIIHSIAPEATIHLIEVLNQFGVGDLETIARGLAKAYLICRKSGGKAVINTSLCLDLPDQKKINAYNPSNKETIMRKEKDFEEYLWQKIDLDVQHLKANPENKSKRLEDELFWVLALRVMCERLNRSGWQVIAAAGNDSKKTAEGQRNAHGTRYPAAFSRVVGVGAVPKNAVADNNDQYEASSFSNLADKPAPTGIMAMGGEEGEGKGVLGVYLGEFPPDEDQNGRPINGHGWAKAGPNSDNGWAWWAGTSFATPILTGVIASVLTASANPATTQRAVQILYDEWIIVQEMTPQLEDGMPSSLMQDVPPPGKWP